MRTLPLLILMILLTSCKKDKKSIIEPTAQIAEVISTDDFKLYKAPNSKALLALFPSGGTTSTQTIESFDISEKANAAGISVLYMNFNRHFSIDDVEANQLEKIITNVMSENDIPENDLFLGGMSIGGNVAIQLADHLATSKDLTNFKGAFIVDAPIDLYALYASCKEELKNNEFTEERKEEPQFIVSYFEEQLGNKDSIINKFEKISPVVLKTNHTQNIKNLKTKKVRFYTEPDTLWWKETRGTDFESTNAYTIQHTAKRLTNQHWNNLELIETNNKGYRSNGDRHPHSWSIVDMDELIEWMIKT